MRRDNLGYVGPSKGKYPYRDEGDSAFLEGKPFIEPFILISAMGPDTQPLEEKRDALRRYADRVIAKV